MKNKKFLFGILAGLLFVSLVLLIVIMLTSMPRPSNNNQNPISSPGGIVNPDENNLDRYSYALVNEEDNIKLKTGLGEELLINIEEKNWRDIKWSKQGENVAVLGETNPDIYNLFIYNLDNKNWLQVTNFETAGITSYDWIDDTTILFTEGGWLHRYKYPSINEVFKIYQIDATIVEVSPNKSTLIMVDANGTFYVMSIEGRLLFTLNRIGFEGGQGFITISKVFYSRDSETLLFLTIDRRVFSWDLGDPSAKEFIPEGPGVQLSNVNIICSTEVDTFEVFTLADTMNINFYTLNLFTNTLDTLLNHTSELPIADIKFNCSNEDTRIVFNIINTDGNNWYQLEDSKIEKLVILDEANFLDIRNNE